MPREPAHCVKTSRSAGAKVSMETMTRSEGHRGAMRSKSARWLADEKMSGIGQWFVLAHQHFRYPLRVCHSHVLGCVGPKRLVQAHTNETIGLTSEIDDLPLFTVGAPDTDSPTSTGTSVQAVAVRGDTVLLDLGRRGQLGRNVGVPEATKALEVEKSRADRVAALLDLTVGSVLGLGAVRGSLSRLGGRIQDAATEHGQVGVAGNRWIC